jgi:FKBP12-rapamycin complex-associated protein
MTSEAALGILKFAHGEMERRGLNIMGLEAKDDLTSRLFNRNHGIGLAYSVMATSDETMALIGCDSASWLGVEMRESWFAELGSWSDGLAMFERKLGESPNNMEAIIGCMRSLDARGEWRRVLDLAKRSWTAINCEEASVKDFRLALKFCAQASWRLKQWDDLEIYSQQLLSSQDGSNSSSSVVTISNLDYDSAFYNVVLHIHKKDWDTAENFIEAARQAMDARFTALMAESYKRAAPSMLRCQALAEMEEIIAYQKFEEHSMHASSIHSGSTQDILESRNHLLSVWKKRLSGCRFDIETHLQIQCVRSLIVNTLEDVDTTLTLSALARQSNSYKLSERLLLDPLEEQGCDLNSTIFGNDLPSHLSLGLMKNQMDQTLSIELLLSGEGHLFFPAYDPNHESFSQKFVKDSGGFDRVISLHKLYFSYLKHLWTIDDRENAISRLSRLSDFLDMVCHCQNDSKIPLRRECWLKLGDWLLSESSPSGGHIKEKSQMEVLLAYKRATSLAQSDYKVWHSWVRHETFFVYFGYY